MKRVDSVVIHHGLHEMKQIDRRTVIFEWKLYPVIKRDGDVTMSDSNTFAHFEYEWARGGETTGEQETEWHNPFFLFFQHFAVSEIEVNFVALLLFIDTTNAYIML